MANAVRSFSEAEYLALERESSTKHEFIAGVIVAMAGARPPHNVLAGNAITLLNTLVRDRDCIVLGSDQRVHVSSTRLYTYPDVTVACGERKYTADDPPSLLTPVVIVEVTSDTTEEYDRGTKFLHYQAIASLQEYALVAHRERRVDHYRRLESGQWLLTTVRGEGRLELPALNGSLSLAELYAKVDLEEGRSG